MDPWTVAPGDLTQALKQDHRGAGILVRLDRRASLRGIDREHLYRRIHAVLKSIRAAESEPILLLSPDFDLQPYAGETTAITFHRLSIEYACPFIDLRDSAP